MEEERKVKKNKHCFKDENQRKKKKIKKVCLSSDSDNLMNSDEVREINGNLGSKEDFKRKKRKKSDDNIEVFVDCNEEFVSEKVSMKKKKKRIKEVDVNEVCVTNNNIELIPEQVESKKKKKSKKHDENEVLVPSIDEKLMSEIELKKKKKYDESNEDIVANSNEEFEIDEKELKKKKKKKKYVNDFVNCSVDSTQISSTEEDVKKKKKHKKRSLDSSSLDKCNVDNNKESNVDKSEVEERKLKTKRKKHSVNSSNDVLQISNSPTDDSCIKMCNDVTENPILVEEVEKKKNKRRKHCVDNNELMDESRGIENCMLEDEGSKKRNTTILVEDVEVSFDENNQCKSLEGDKKKKKKRKSSLMGAEDLVSDTIKCNDNDMENSSENVEEKTTVSNEDILKGEDVEKLEEVCTDKKQLWKVESNAKSENNNAQIEDLNNSNTKSKTFPLYIGNLGSNITEGILIKHFSQCGSFKIKMIENLEFPLCFMIFFDEEGAKEALKKNNSMLRQRKLIVSKSIKDVLSKVKDVEEVKNSSKTPNHITSEYSIIISAISKNVRRNTLYQQIKKKVKGDFLINYKRSSCVCIVHLFDKQDEQEILKLHNVPLDGRQIMVLPLNDPGMGKPQIVPKETAKKINIEKFTNCTNILTLLVTNLPEDIQIIPILEHFSDCGPVKAYLQPRRNAHLRSRVCFLEVTDVKYYKIALAKYDTVLCGNKISVFESGVPIYSTNEPVNLINENNNHTFQIIIYNYKPSVKKEDIIEVINLHTPFNLQYTPKLSYLTVHSVIDFQNVLAANFSFVQRGVIFFRPDIEKQVLIWKNKNNIV